MRRITDGKEAEAVVNESGQVPTVKSMITVNGLFFTGFDKHKQPLFSFSDIGAKEYKNYPKSKVLEMRKAFNNIKIQYVYYFDV